VIRPRPRYSGAMFRDIARPIFTTAAAVLRSNACSVPINTIITSTRRYFVKRSIPAPPRRRYRREIIFVSEDTYGGEEGLLSRVCLPRVVRDDYFAGQNGVVVVVTRPITSD